MANSKRNNYDRISTLPDDILCYILSFIHTKYAVRSSVLSTRWKNLFTLVPVLDFSILPSTKAQYTNNDNFIDFVYRVHHLYDVANIRRLNLYLTQKTEAGFFSWISAAIFRNVQEIVLNTSCFKRSIQLPYDLFTSKTLVELKVQGYFTFTLLDSMCLPNLKTLHLSGEVLCVGESMNLSFSNCPMLEDLCLDGTIKFIGSGIDISLSSLKRLKLCLPYGVCNLVLNAPALEFFNYWSYASTKISGNVLESLVEAQIGFVTPIDYQSQNIFEMVSNVHKLHLFCESMKVLALGNFELPRYQNLTRLVLTEGFGWKLLPDLLESSPNLEILIFKYGLLGYQKKSIEIDDVLPKCECSCLALHLKELEIRRLSGIECEFQLVEYFLENAKVLNKLVIRSTEPPETQKMITQRLLAFPRYSSDCQIVVLNKFF